MSHSKKPAAPRHRVFRPAYPVAICLTLTLAGCHKDSSATTAPPEMAPGGIMAPQFDSATPPPSVVPSATTTPDDAVPPPHPGGAAVPPRFVDAGPRDVKKPVKR